MATRKKSVVWDHFMDLGNSVAVCKICKGKLSYKASVTNLKKHLERRHFTITLVSGNIGGSVGDISEEENRNGALANNLSGEGANSIVSHCGGTVRASVATRDTATVGGATAGCSTAVGSATARDTTSGCTASASLIAPGGAGTVVAADDATGNGQVIAAVGGATASGEGSAARNGVTFRTKRTFGQPNLNAYMAKRRRVDKVVIDQKIMQLFTLDFQPFRIMEDRGFRELLAYAFPGYVIPTRKFFANNMLPSLHEQKKADLLQKIYEEAPSVCVTVDMWSSVTNESFLAVTGHYITEKDCELHAVLLDCIPVEQAHTSANIAAAIKVVTDEYQITTKVSLGVSDNGANIKRAIQVDLGWKHFPCYAHSLNLAVKSVIGKPELQATIGKCRDIVRYFKKSNIGWQKLKRYQEQAGQTPLRCLQDVSTRWNSTFYMLRRLVTIKESINSALINLSMVTLSPEEWEICESLCEILHPCEEVTREISGQKYVTGSLVIPITTGLLVALYQINGATLHPIIDEARQDLIAAIRQNFPHLSRSRTFTNAMFLDPRFKLYFDDAAIAEETKHRMREMVTSNINRQSNGEPAILGSGSTQENFQPTTQTDAS